MDEEEKMPLILKVIFAIMFGPPVILLVMSGITLIVATAVEMYRDLKALFP